MMNAGQVIPNAVPMLRQYLGGGLRGRCVCNCWALNGSHCRNDERSVCLDNRNNKPFSEHAVCFSSTRTEVMEQLNTRLVVQCTGYGTVVQITSSSKMYNSTTGVLGVLQTPEYHVPVSR